ncbi:MAG: dTMP kinase [Deltaproteobacteria bacterium]|nr:dTMP kinase [Deltaproteobacteria bacterium]MBW2155920.1 dTMP kinase [Deltaproteobacteria bacterium]MBW2197242.1 dTMP kinase [Deltaproteobacteria bacterium]MBW2225937.1 dTMP kinase [Deltaproteobacteria bacterium]MBW2326680.1 dTMP kinase [Deltaproteobacteria bacterium]
MFISLEGIEGSGKTTNMRHAVRFLQDKGHDCVITREPGGTRIGEKIRAILLDPSSKEMDPLTELLLYTADRSQHIKELISPLLSEGKTVVCDRYYDATVVYQGYARGLDTELILGLHRLLFENLKPDITLLLDLPPEIGLSRAWKQIDRGDRDRVETRFEEETLSFHKKVRSGYLEMARLEPERFRIIDASQEPDQVRKEITRTLSEEIDATP